MLKHSLSADIIRTLAGLGVVAIHVTDYFINYPLLFGGVSWWLANGANSVGRISVPLFIMLSGYLVLDDSKKYTLGTMLKKSLRLFGILIIWTLIYLMGMFMTLSAGITLAYYLLKIQGIVMIGIYCLGFASLLIKENSWFKENYLKLSAYLYNLQTNQSEKLDVFFHVNFRQLSEIFFQTQIFQPFV